jgi:uncharacterized protein
MAKKTFTATLEPVAECNLDCKYCYSTNNSGRRLEEAVFLDTLGGIARYASDRDFKELHCVWLGGEPLLAGIHFFERVASLTSRLSSHMIVRHFIQTNGLLLDSDYCRILGDANVHLGVSLDGPRAIHDAFRITRSGEPTHGRVLESLGLLRKHHLPFGCVAVATRLTLGREKEIYDFFRTLGCGFRINPQIPGAKGSEHAHPIDPEEYGQCLVRFFDAWNSPDPVRVNVSPLDNYVLAAITGEPRECQHQPSCAANTVGLKPNGDVTLCGRFQDLVVGNVTRSPIIELLTARETEPPRARAPLLEGCRSCAHWSRCHGGCPHNALAHGRAMNAKDPFCPAYKAIFDHIRDALNV